MVSIAGEQTRGVGDGGASPVGVDGDERGLAGLISGVAAQRGPNRGYASVGSVHSTRLEEDRLREALRAANIPSLVPVLFQLTGDRRWLRASCAPTRGRGMNDNQSGGLPDEVQDEIRAAAFEAVLASSQGAPSRFRHRAASCSWSCWALRARPCRSTSSQ